MKFCWDNLEKLQYDKISDTFFYKKIRQRYVLKESCETCGETFLAQVGGKNKFCCILCRKPDKNTRLRMSTSGKRKKLTQEHKNKISNSHLGKKISEELKYKLLMANLGRKHTAEHRRKNGDAHKGLNCGANHPFWKGGVKAKNIPLFDTYAHQVSWCEEVRRDPEDNNILQVKCTYCGKWYRPKLDEVRRRIGGVRGNISGEQRFYCSTECKQLCPIFGQKSKYKFQEGSYEREVQPQLRQMVFERDNWTCKKCNNTKELYCHHIEGIRWEPLESADIDKCITLCKNCHEEAHKKEGCSTYNMRCDR